jgi:serine O-acetyltransferase
MTLRNVLDADWARLQQLSGSASLTRPWSSCVSPRFAPVWLLRVAQALHSSGWPRAAKAFSLLNVLLFGFEVPTRLPIGPGLVIPHPYGTVLGAARIGANATIFQQVTLGAAAADFEFNPSARPIVGDGVTITAGAKVLGPLILGDGCTVGANAVVLMDVPPNSLAVGVPARIVPRATATDHAA